MRRIQPLEQLTAADLPRFGGKAVALAELTRCGYSVPQSLAIPCDCYRDYLQATGLGARLTMELGRKDFSQMRWEELWDAALRIRNLFLTTSMPPSLEVEITTALNGHFPEQPLVIRSSAPGEDSASCSFAGLHDSFVNVRGRREQLLAIRKVWASLWSDRALLYRQELGLRVADSSMAVLIQELIVGETSGVSFSVAPDNRRQLMVEAVRGLNQGLVDGSVEPDSWQIDRDSLQTVSYRAGHSSHKLVPRDGQVQLVPLTPAEQGPVLNGSDLAVVARQVLALEQEFSTPQDCEWTWCDGRLILLQARPVTTVPAEDDRLWYFNLHRSLTNLKQLQQRIETEIMPGMEEVAARFARVELTNLSDTMLEEEFRHRLQQLHYWEETYRHDCIPMAHGIRLFGEFYNDVLQPQEPFEFLELLRGGELRALMRNRRMADLASRWDGRADSSIMTEIDEVAAELGLLPDQLGRLLLQLTDQQQPQVALHREDLESAYRHHFNATEWPQAEEILAIGRASYRLRDDDNISLAQLQREVKRGEMEVRRRCRAAVKPKFARLLEELTDGKNGLRSPSPGGAKADDRAVRARQLQGQPASAGLATAVARVIRSEQDLADFRRGEILVCDAIDPVMTFIVPLAAGIVERRGGMLIHGAIIAREYGIPCVSGIAGAADIINSGDLLTIDGYLGLVFFPATSGRLASSPQPHQLRKELDDAVRQ
ncbi:MAG: PEP/pyruvate-binding domain-containing protein [Pelovirga sp.]